MSASCRSSISVWLLTWLTCSAPTQSHRWSETPLNQENFCPEDFCYVDFTDWFSPSQLSARSRRRRTWMRSTAPPSRPSWAPRCGTRRCPTTETPSSWSTWTWKSSCLRTVSPPAPPTTTTTTTTSTNRTLHHANRQSCLKPRPHPRPLWWTSVTTPPPPYTQASSLRTACTAARQEQVRPKHSSHLVETRVTQSKSQPRTKLVFFGLESSPSCFIFNFISFKRFSLPSLLKRSQT